MSAPAPAPDPRGLPPDARPVLPRGVRVAEDRVRGGKVLLAPERALRLDATGAAVLGEVDGTRSLREIAETLAARYEAPAERILADATTFLTALWARRMLDLAA